MTAIDENVTAISQEPSESNSPDWECIPFDVSCSRCGCDLRGLSEPVCPTCRLIFEWSEVAPIEQLTCLHCQYHLYGLTENRCPECGNAFTWEEVLLDYQHKRKPLFEYRWRKTPVRSFFGTWLRTLRPKKFWSMLDLHDPPQARALGIMVFASILVFYLCEVFMETIDTWLWYGISQWRFSRFYNSSMWLWISDFPSAFIDSFTTNEIISDTLSLFLWMATSMVSLLVFQQSMRRYKILTVQIFRVWSYSIPFAPILVSILSYLISYYYTISGEWYPIWVDVFGGLFLIVFVIRSLQIAYSKYLRMDHGLGVAISSQIMAVLLALIILDLFGDRGFGIRIAIQFLDWIH